MPPAAPGPPSPRESKLSSISEKRTTTQRTLSQNPCCSQIYSNNLQDIATSVTPTQECHDVPLAADTMSAGQTHLETKGEKDVVASDTPGTPSRTFRSYDLVDENLSV